MRSQKLDANKDPMDTESIGLERSSTDGTKTAVELS